MVKRALMIAFHLPPMKGSSGIQRTLRFAQHLPTCGWQPVLLTAHQRAYQHTSADQIDELRALGPVQRAFALDSARHLALLGRYPALLALPDRWASWALGAIPAGLRLIRRHRPDLIWSTYPIATAHLIALTLHRLTGIAWVADMRDPMTDTDYPPARLTRRIYSTIENGVANHCAAMVCTTPGAIQRYQQRFPHLTQQRLRLIENGFDEADFAATSPCARPDQRFLLVHSGVIYPSERDPSALFAALARLRASGHITPCTLRVLLRASGHDNYLRSLIAAHAIGDIVELAPALPYRAALAEMLSADALLLLQAANCNAQVPAKLYEYLRAGRPILTLTDPAGDTAATLRACGIDTIARLDCPDAIAHALPLFLAAARAGTAPLANAQTVASHSRVAGTRRLAQLFDQITEAI